MTLQEDPMRPCDIFLSLVMISLFNLLTQTTFVVYKEMPEADLPGLRKTSIHEENE